MEVIQLVFSSVIFPYAASFTVEFYVSIFLLSTSFINLPFYRCILFQTDKKSQDLKEKPAIEENAFEALERDFQEVCIERKTRFLFSLSRSFNVASSTMQEKKGNKFLIFHVYRFSGNSWEIRVLKSFA